MQSNRKWIALSLFFTLSWLGGAAWCAYSPIVSKAEDYYRVSESAINWFEMCFFLMYFALAPATPYILQNYTNLTLTFSGIITIACLWLKYFIGRHYAGALIAQIMVGSLTPIMLSGVTVIPKKWFPEEQQLLALTLAAMANLMGTGIGFLISAYADDIELIDLIQALLSLITVPMIFLLRQPNKEDLLDVNFKNELKFLWLNKFLILVFIPISVEFGVIYSLLGILQEVLDVDVILTGQLGAILVLCGMAGSLSASYLVERKMDIEKISYILKGISICIFIIWSLMPSITIIHIFMSAVLGLCYLAVLPLGIEICLQKGRISEGLISNIIFAGSQLFAFGFTYLFLNSQAIIPQVSGMIMGAVLLILVNGLLIFVNVKLRTQTFIGLTMIYRSKTSFALIQSDAEIVRTTAGSVVN